MSGVNKVILIGNVGNDPEFKVMPNGDGVCNLSIATSEEWKDKTSGEKKEKTEWHRVVFFRRLAEIVNEYVKKGSKIYVEGRLQTRSWEQDGIKRYSTEIVANEMRLLDSRQTQNQGQAYQQPAQKQYEQSEKPQAALTPPAQQAAPEPTPDSSYDFDDDIPF